MSQIAMKPVVAAAVLFCAAGAAPPATAAEPVIGGVVRLQGAGTGTSEGLTADLAAGSAVRLNQRIATGKDARLELAFDDGSRLTVGEAATVVLDKFVYDPSGANTLHAAISGPFRFVTGKLGAGATRQASVTTPYALIGIRGTDFWGGPIDGGYGVFLVEGAVAVSAGGVETLLQAPGSSTDIAGVGAAPGGATAWSADKIARAVATVTFR